MHGLVVAVIRPRAEIPVEVGKGPDGLPGGIDRWGQEARVLGGLRVAPQRVDELRIGGAEEAFNDGAKAGLGTGTRLLRTGIAREHTLEGGTAECGPAIDDHNLRQALMALHTHAEDHHAGAVRRRVKGQRAGQEAPGEGIHRTGDPGTPQHTPKGGTEFDVELGVIDMHHLPGAIPMPGGRPRYLPLPGLLLLRGPGPVAASGWPWPGPAGAAAGEGRRGQGRRP